MSEADSSENPMRLLESTGALDDSGGGLGDDGDDYLEDNLLFLDRDPDDDDDGNEVYHDNSNNNRHNTRLGMPPPPPPPPLPPYNELQAAAGLYGRARNNNYIGAAPHSPGNTSLSSWDSPHTSRRVHIHYSPPRNSDTESKSSTGPFYSTNNNRQQRQHSDEEKIAGVSNTIMKTPERLPVTGRPKGNTMDPQQQFSSNSTSPASEGHMERLEEFLDDLRVNSEGKVQDSGGLESNTSFESSLFPGPADGQEVWRKRSSGSSGQIDGTTQQRETRYHQSSSSQQQHERMASIGTDIIQNVSNPTIDQSNDEHTLAMVLSDSEYERDNNDAKADSDDPNDDTKSGEGSNKNIDALPPSKPPKSDVKVPTPQQVPTQAPVEKKGLFDRGAAMFRRKARKAFQQTGIASNSIGGEDSEEKPSPPEKIGKPTGHRRQRSGDAAAATLATGSDQWRGMELYQIPMPDGAGDETEDDTASDKKKASSNGGGSNHSRGRSTKVKGTIDRREEYSQRKLRRESDNSIKSSTTDKGKDADKITNSPPSPFTRQKKEIAQFSQFALGTGEHDDNATRNPRRKKQSSYRSMRRRYIQGDSGDSSSHDDDSGYAGFFQPPPISPRGAPRMYSSPTLSGYSQSPSNSQWSSSQPPRKTYSLQDVQHSPQMSAGQFDNSFSELPPPPPPPPTYNLSSSWGADASSQFQQSLPPYVPAFNIHQRSQSEMPGQALPFFPPSVDGRRGSDIPPNYIPPPPTHEHFLPPNMNFYYQFPGHSSPMISSDGQIFHQAPPPTFPPKTRSFDVPPNEASPMAFDRKTPPGIHLSPQQTEEKDKNDHTRDEESYIFSDDQSTDDDDDLLEYERNVKRLHEAHYEERVIRHHNNVGSPFSIFNSSKKFDRRQFLPQTSTVFEDGSEKATYPTYICPVCNTRQREFFTVSSAPRQFEGPGGFIAFYFAIYVIGSLYIFGLQEGWGKLDCIYFAVITLTTAGLGDFVPTSDGAKITCSVFIYFGVACIGLLLGSYIAGMLDERSHREAIANQIKACPNCARIQNIKDAAERRRQAVPKGLTAMHAMTSRGSVQEVPTGRAFKKAKRTDAIFESERTPLSHTSGDDAFFTPKTVGKTPDLNSFESPPVQEHVNESPTSQNHLLGSPMTSQILGRQSHTKHFSMDFGSSSMPGFDNFNPLLSSSRRTRNFSVDIPATVEEGVQSKDGPPMQDSFTESSNMRSSPNPFGTRFNSTESTTTSGDEYSMDSTDSYSSSMTDGDEIEEQFSRVRNAKYIFLTLREALVNSMVIIAFGCMGFYLIEGFSLIDSWYFTTVLLTTGMFLLDILSIPQHIRFHVES